MQNLGLQAKCTVSSITKNGAGIIATLSLERDNSVPESRQLSSNPNGTLELRIDNPEAVELFEQGRIFSLQLAPTSAVARAGG